MIFKFNPTVLYFFLSFLFLFGCKKSEPTYSIEIERNPYKIAPLTAELKIKSSNPCSASFKVLGKTPIAQSFKNTNTQLTIPIVGLYPNKINDVVITLKFENKVIIDTIEIRTPPVPNFFPKIEINKVDRQNMEAGIHACDLHFANYGKFKSIPLFFDDEGIVRWYLDLSFKDKMISPFQKLQDGTILMVDRHAIYEFNMLGKALRKTTIDTNYGMHHDVVELPNGDLLICVGTRDAYINIDGENIQSDSDHIILLDRKKGIITKEWDLAKHLDVSRNDINSLRKGDWLHMNALAFVEKDSSIIISGKNQGIIKLSWNDELKWILAPKKSWGNSGRTGEGPSTQSFLLTAVDKNDIPYSKNVQLGLDSDDDFDFSWGQHAPKLMPNGNLLAFDNGSHRNFGDRNKYSRAVEYQIDERKKEVKQLWQYGKEQGESFFSLIVSDVDYLPKTKNILITSGYILPENNHSGKIVEVNPISGKEVFEATLYFKTLTGNKTGAWGQQDILYRSERMELKY